MDDGMDVAFYILVGAVVTLAVSVLVLPIIDCIERRRRRREEDMAVGFAVAAIDDVSFPRQHQGGASAEGDGSTTTAADRPECVFCLAELEDGEDADEWVVLRTCHHEFHRMCMAKWLAKKKSSCPTCRAVLWPGVLRQTPPALADMV
ncbi:unnamed protein product [Alopecurus aequalis]